MDALSDTHRIMDLANLIREKGTLMDPESDADETDRWSFPCEMAGRGGLVVFHAAGEMTNRLYLAEGLSPYTSVVLDVREDTIIGFQFSKGSPKELEAVYRHFSSLIIENKQEMEAVDQKRASEGLSVVDGMGTHKL